ncbi:MAG: hypothetical protein GXP31_09010 [Kiritimatiellaeota bacterium]|nr:hypothetical protein [Kiritimatiellota bacterium]
MHIGRAWWSLLPLILAGGLLRSTAAGIVVEGKEEILYLDGLAEPTRWRPAECTVTRAAQKFRAEGRPTLHLHIPVDYSAGEKQYPIGWPRMYCGLRKPDETDWTRFDRFEFMIYAEMSRPKPPSKPLTFQMLCPLRDTGYVHELTEIRLGRWVRIVVPIADKPNLERIATLGFNISESNYRDGDRLDFYVGAFRLVRSTECALSRVRILAPAIFQGRPDLPVELVVTGPPARVGRGIPFTIRRGKEALRREMLPVTRGRQVLHMGIAELDLSPGDYTLTAFDDDPEKRRTAHFKVVATPWKGAQ